MIKTLYGRQNTIKLQQHIYNGEITNREQILTAALVY